MRIIHAEQLAMCVTLKYSHDPYMNQNHNYKQ